jgi:hypothetical protein
VANNTIIEGDYIIEFAAIVNEKSSLLDKHSNLNKVIGTNKDQNSFSKNYTGRHGQLFLISKIMMIFIAIKIVIVVIKEVFQMINIFVLYAKKIFILSKVQIIVLKIH